MTEFQEKIYKYHARKEIKRLDQQEEKGNKGGQSSLKSITRLKKAVNHPALLSSDEMADKWIPSEFSFKECQPEFSGKMWLLEQMLCQIKYRL